MGDRVVGLRRWKKILYVSELAEGVLPARVGMRRHVAAAVGKIVRTPRQCGDESDRKCTGISDAVCPSRWRG